MNGSFDEDPPQDSSDGDEFDDEEADQDIFIGYSWRKVAEKVQGHNITK